MSERTVINISPRRTTLSVTAPVVRIAFTQKQGPQGPPGRDGAGALTLTAGVALSGERVVTTDASGLVVYADSATLAHAGRIAGVTKAAAAQGDAVDVQQNGTMTYSGWAWTPGSLLYLGANGAITDAEPTLPSALFSQIIGFAATATKIIISIQEPIILN